MSRFANRSANRVDYDAVLARGDKPEAASRIRRACLLLRLRQRLAACRRRFKFSWSDYRKEFAIYNYGLNRFSAGGWR